MASSFMGKILNLMGFEETLIDEQTEQEEQPAWQPSPSKAGRSRGKVVSLPTAPGAGGKVVVSQPTSFDEAKDIADHLKNRRMVIVNLEGTDPSTAQRIVDFASGAAFALSGSIERVGKEIFLFAPSNVDVEAAYSLGMEDKELLSWLG